MRILALILARGGSKRVPGKNVRRLGSKPLVVWSIEAGKGVAEICDILVSTDDAEIAGIAKSAGAMVPWLRPAELATDTATSVDACLHALDWYEQEKGPIDGILLLQPTSPFRSRELLRAGIDLFRANRGRSVVGMSPAKSHPLWCFRMVDGSLIPYIDGDRPQLRSQDLPAAYVINGAFYLTAPGTLRRTRAFSADMVPLIMEGSADSIDIDSEWDFQLAEAIVDMREAGK
ncbi:MAG: acylneuraminate cytidylyltransferase family protein [Steroidobacteraceae bacterium]